MLLMQLDVLLLLAVKSVKLHLFVLFGPSLRQVSFVCIDGITAIVSYFKEVLLYKLQEIDHPNYFFKKSKGIVFEVDNPCSC